ncbi:hypothetical protein AALB53_03190 [Lachnospiraceae bacterium 47-T17]
MKSSSPLTISKEPEINAISKKENAAETFADLKDIICRRKPYRH